ncbi:MAG: AMP-binding protein [Candidatus Cloacimonetes bacterium]|nr:AMP-binding protein [Candidatus Cloacimonadota bacterium]
MQLQQAFIATAKKYSKKIALYDQATEKDFTYDKLLIASLILSKKLSVYPEPHIGIMIPTSAGCMLSILASLIIGKIPVMINYSTGAANNCIYAQEKCSFKTIITSKKLMETLNIEFVPGMIFIEDILATLTTGDKIKAALRSKLPTGMLQNSVHHGSEDETSIILFTSGSEKDPKAVQLTHKNIFHNVKSCTEVFEFSHEDIFLGNLPLFHVFGLTTNLWIPLIVGSAVVTHANPLDYKKIVDSIINYKITIMIGTPAFFFGYFRRSKPGDFSSVRIAVAGADKLTNQIREAYQKHHGIELLEGYGTTETSPVISVNLKEANKPGSIGKPIPGVQVKILDRETDEELPRGKEGKIVVKGDLVMKGYYGDLEETSLRIHNGWYDTGDMGILDDDGFLWHRGRLRRFVKIGGEMVSLVKVEDVLNKLLPNDVVCCVVDVPNPTKGADIVAALTTAEIDFKKIKKQMAKELPSIAIPKEFHVIEDIPMMGTGKVNFREVEQICREYLDNGKKHKS